MTEPAPTAPAAIPALRLVVVPTPQPPLEDGPVRLVVPGVRPPRPPHRPGPRPRSAPAAGVADAEFGPAWSARADLPDLRQSGRRLITTTLEALAGRRPMTQLQPLTSLGVYTALSRGGRPRWCADGTAPLIVGPVHVCEPVDGVAEISAVARRAGRAHAVAARLEGIDGRWRCTALQIG
ncbi:Rv3235 family protein [Geodermatophilus sp. URMC 64]